MHFILSSVLVKLILARSHVGFFTMVRRRHISTANSLTKLRKPTCKSAYRRGKKKLFAGIGSVRTVKNCAASGSIFKTSVTVFHYTVFHYTDQITYMSLGDVSQNS